MPSTRLRPLCAGASSLLGNCLQCELIWSWPHSPDDIDHFLACAGVLVHPIDISPLGNVFQLISDLHVKLVSGGSVVLDVFGDFAELCLNNLDSSS